MEIQHVEEEQSILLIKQKNSLDQYCIAFDPSSFDIMKISASPFIDENLIVIYLDKSDIIDSIFYGTSNISEFKIAYDGILNDFFIEKIIKKSGNCHLYNKYTITNTKNRLIDVIINDKKISFCLNYDELSNRLSNRAESSINDISVFVTDINDYTKLFGCYSIELAKLVDLGTLDFHINWFDRRWQEIGYDAGVNLLVYGGVDVGFGRSQFSNIKRYRPQIVYGNKKSKIILKSFMKNTNNYLVRDKITFFMYNNAALVQTIELDSKCLDGKNIIQLENIGDMITDMKSDHSHLYIENENNTHYRI